MAHTPNPLELPELNRVLTPKENYLLIAGRLHPQKGHDVLFKAISMLGDEVEGWRLRILGTGPLEKELKALARELNISQNIDWLGGQVDLQEHYREASIFVMPSRYEGVSNAMLEAMSYRLPVVVSAVGGALEYVEHEVNGLLVPIDDVPALAAALRQLIDDEALRERLAAAARTTAAGIVQRDPVAIWEQLLSGTD